MLYFMNKDERRVYNLKRYHTKRNYYIEMLGGECVLCGSKENLEFDHIDPTTKKLDVGKLLNYSKAVAEAELSKCQLLCKTHHIAKSRKEASVEHGGGASGKKNCKCAPCRLRKAEYMKNYKRKRLAGVAGVD